MREQPLELIGYSSRLSVRAGETISFHVSSRAARYEASLVRLVHGDDNPDGPGFREVVVPSPIDGGYDGVEHGFASGSSITVADAEPLRLAGSFVLSAWVYPTAPGCGRQTILAKGEAYGLGLAEDGRLELWVEGRRVDTGVPLRAGGWYRVTGRFDTAAGRAHVAQEPLRPWPGFGGAEGSAAPFGPPRPSADPLLIGACAEGGEARRHFNGKIDGPEILAGADDGAEPVARWDLALTVGAPEHVADRGPFGLDGTAVNMPLRAVTGRRWSGEEHDFRRAPEHYSAIHFHDDDLEDAGWPVAFELNVPDGLPSGVYAARTEHRPLGGPPSLCHSSRGGRGCAPDRRTRPDAHLRRLRERARARLQPDGSGGRRAP